MFAEDYRELGILGAEQVAARCFLFEQFIEAVLSHEPQALHQSPDQGAPAPQGGVRQR